MANQSDKSTTVQDARRDGKHHLFMAARDGYVDASNGKGFRSTYETAAEWYQQNYERGRLWAISYRSIGMVPPAWRDNVMFPNKLKQTAERVCHAHGFPSIPLR